MLHEEHIIPTVDLGSLWSMVKKNCTEHQSKQLHDVHLVAYCAPPEDCDAAVFPAFQRAWNHAFDVTKVTVKSRFKFALTTGF